MSHNANQDEHTPARRRLGRGLNALLGGASSDNLPESSPSRQELHQIDVGAIEPNPFQPRKEFDEDSLEELVKSIRQHGVLQPVLLRPSDGGYQLIAGERRWLAAKRAGLKTVPCRVLDLEDQRVSEAAFEENLKRKDLNPLEKAQAFQDYLDRFGCSIEVLARRLSMRRSTVSNFLRLLELPSDVKRSLASDKITNGHARALLPLDESNQIALCRRIQTESLSVRSTEQAVRKLLQHGSAEPAKSPTANPPSSAPNVTNHVLSLERQLRDSLGAKVEIRLRGDECGKIVIAFASNDEFEHIIRHLRRAA